MPMYERSTRALTCGQLPSPLKERLELAAKGAQVVLEPGARAWLTRSDNGVQPGLLGKLFGRRRNPADEDAWHESAVVVTPSHVFVVVHRERGQTTAMTCPLAGFEWDRTALDGELGFRLVGFRVDVTDPHTPHDPRVSERGTYYVGLGPEPAAAECLAALESAFRS